MITSILLSVPQNLTFEFHTRGGRVFRGMLKTAVIGFVLSSHSLGAFCNACNDGGRLLGSEISPQLLVHPTVKHLLGERVESLASCDMCLFQTSSPLQSDTVSFTMDVAPKPSTTTFSYKLVHKSAMEGAGPSVAMSNSSTRKRQKLVVSAPEMGAFPQCRDPQLRRENVLSAVCKAEISENVHTLPPMGSIVEAALLAERVGAEAGVLVTELEQIKAANRDLHATNETLRAKLTNATIQIGGLQEANQQLEEENAH
uniref:Uncharacterized protein n=1 Tax=Cannabis sativa TaxID=3483 RepID=A0A803NJB9_CANSA